VWIFKELNKIDEGYQVEPHYGHHIGVGPSSFGLALYHQHEQLHEQPAPDLYFYGILVVSQKVFQGEVLFKALEHGLYLPSVLVYISYLVRFQFKMVGDEPVHFLVIVVPIVDAP
jgi:hypothetical protein